jgi:hypothetical protein
MKLASQLVAAAMPTPLARRELGKTSAGRTRARGSYVSDDRPTQSKSHTVKLGNWAEHCSLRVVEFKVGSLSHVSNCDSNYSLVLGRISCSARLIHGARSSVKCRIKQASSRFVKYLSVQLSGRPFKGPSGYLSLCNGNAEIEG